MTSYSTSMNTISLSRTVLEIMPVKVLKVAQNGGIWPFQGQGHWLIFFIFRKGSDSRQTASNDISRVKIGSAVLAAPSSKSVKSWKKKNFKKKKEKKDEPLYVGYMYFRPRNQILLDYLGRWCNQSCQIFFHSVHLGYLWQGVKLCHFQCKPWVAITTVVLPYNCDKQIVLWDTWFLSDHLSFIRSGHP